MGEAPQILVTGATGFIGTHLVGKLAEEGRPMRCLVRGSSLEVARDHLSCFGAELVYGDLTDSGSLGAATEGVTTVFHLGGGGTVQMTSMDDYLRINVDATRNLLDAAADDPIATPPRPPTASHRLSRHPRGGGGRGAFAAFSPQPWRGRALRPEKGGSMHALRVHEQGGPEGPTYQEAPIPEPGTGDVLVRVHAASFTPTELTWPSTWVDRLGHDRRPVIPGHEVSGTVEALGWGTTGFDVGDAVYGLTDWYRDGALAEYVAMEARNLAPKPASLDHVQAAALPMPGLTAWQALFVHGGLSEGQRVLIHGAGGGVGTVAVQLARAAGAHVIATGRAWARDRVSELGAERFVDLDRERFEEVAEGVDLVVDLVGGEILQRSVVTVKEGGIVVSVVEDPRAQLDEVRQARGFYFVVEPARSELEELARRADAGDLRPVVGEVFDLADVGKAFEAKAGGGVPGKVVLRIWDQ